MIEGRDMRGNMAAGSLPAGGRVWSGRCGAMDLVDGTREADVSRPAAGALRGAILAPWTPSRGRTTSSTSRRSAGSRRSSAFSRPSSSPNCRASSCAPACGSASPRPARPSCNASTWSGWRSVTTGPPDAHRRGSERGRHSLHADGVAGLESPGRAARDPRHRPRRRHRGERCRARDASAVCAAGLPRRARRQRRDAPSHHVQPDRLLIGDKADFWLLTDDSYDRERFARRLRVEALGLELCVSTPEDTILMKLRWSAQAGGSEKQFNDALGVYELQGEVLDTAYLDTWAETLGLSAALAEIRSRRRTEADEPGSA